MKLTNEELQEIQSIIIEKIGIVENNFTNQKEYAKSIKKVKELNSLLDKLGAMKI
jgi:hypothetical protein